MPPIQFAYQAYKLPDTPIDAQRCVNFYAEREPPDAKSRIPIIGVPGLSPFVAAGAGPIRGLLIAGGVLYAVSGPELYSVTPNKIVTRLGGGIAGRADLVSMSYNGRQLIIATGAAGYVYDALGIQGTLAATAVAYAGAVVVTSTTGMKIGDQLQIGLDGGGIFQTTVSGFGPGGTVDLTDDLPGQASAGTLITDLDNNFIRISDPNFQPAWTATYFDDYFVFPALGTRTIFCSQLLDGTTYPPLFFSTAEVQPGNVVAIVNQLEALLIFCADRIETWYDAGSVNFPFDRYDGGTIERGIAAPFAVVKEDNAVFWLGDDLIFYRLNGIFPQRVSTHAIEKAWQAYRSVLDASCFSYTAGGHKFVVVNFPTGGATFVYDISSGLWHERMSYDADANELGRWRGSCRATDTQFFPKTLIGDAFSGNIGFVDETVWTEFGMPLLATAVSPPTHNDRKRIFVSRFELDMRVGAGLPNGHGSDPVILMDYSTDGANTFRRARGRSMGKIGNYLQRVRWLGLGQGWQYAFRIRISDPVPRTIIAAHADIEGENG